MRAFVSFRSSGFDMSESSKQQFESSRLKVKRAYSHIKELESLFQAFLNSDFCRVVIDGEPGAGPLLIKVVSIASPPPEMSLVIGDAVHNLRASLDHVIVQIFGKGSHQTAFPVAKNRDNPGSHSTYGLIRKTLPKLAALLTDEIGIHDTGDVCLWAISALDNIDKHNLLIAVASVQALSNFRVEDKAHNNVFNLDVVIGPDNRAAIPVSYGARGRLEITSHGQPGAQILFGKDQPLEGRPVVASLKQLAELTLHAIQTLEFFWFGESQKG